MPSGGVGPTPSRPSQLPGAARLQAKALKRVKTKERKAVYFAPSRTDDTAERDGILTVEGGPPFLPARLDPCLHLLGALGPPTDSIR